MEPAVRIPDPFVQFLFIRFFQVPIRERTLFEGTEPSNTVLSSILVLVSGYISAILVRDAQYVY
jgi:hypothetical protein